LQNLLIREIKLLIVSLQSDNLLLQAHCTSLHSKIFVKCTTGKTYFPALSILRNNIIVTQQKITYFTGNRLYKIFEIKYSSLANLLHLLLNARPMQPYFVSSEINRKICRNNYF